MEKYKNKFGEKIYETGIYQITFKSSEHCYIGMASAQGKFPCKRGFYCRWARHIQQLKKRSHKNVFLQRMYNKYGEDNLEFKILEYCSPEDCPTKELEWFEKIKPEVNFQGNKKYIKPEFYPISEETRKKRSDARLGSKHTEDTKKKMSLSAKKRIYKKKVLSVKLIESFVEHVAAFGNVSEFRRHNKCSIPTLKYSIEQHLGKLALEELWKIAITNGRKKSIKIMTENNKGLSEKTLMQVPTIVGMYKKGYNIASISKRVEINEDLVGNILRMEIPVNQLANIKNRYLAAAQLDSKTSPKNIKHLFKNEVFVFGSNEAGFHGSGAAWDARHRFNAELYNPVGIQGDCYAIPTKDRFVKTISIDRIKPYVDDFIQVAINRPDLKFLVTEIGCGLAGYKPKDIAPLFEAAIEINNILLPSKFLKILRK